MNLSQAIGNTQNEEERRAMDPAALEQARTPGIAEEIPEDAYKQNYVYRSYAAEPEHVSKAIPTRRQLPAQAARKNLKTLA